MGQHIIIDELALWSAAGAKARAEGTSLDAVIAGALAAYTGAVTVLGITVIPDVRMPPGVAAVVSPGCKPAPFTLPGPPSGGQPWSRPDATPLQRTSAKSSARTGSAHRGRPASKRNPLK
jgi:hypothetical protein